MSLEYNRELIPRARELRKEMTAQERRLWYTFLAQQRPRFQRQKVISGFIVDFYCHAARLVIEVDGAQHRQESAIGYDAERTQILESFDLLVLRFTNREVDLNFQGVCQTIHETVQKRTRP
ncbi:MAG: DUF559 domain-containing protein [Oscillospiraceae bacterium]|nr:DUF559 domain-containing protein [Oscillospiraceae bacterium]